MCAEFVAPWTALFNSEQRYPLVTMIGFRTRSRMGSSRCRANRARLATTSGGGVLSIRSRVAVNDRVSSCSVKCSESFTGESSPAGRPRSGACPPSAQGAGRTA